MIYYVNFEEKSHLDSIYRMRMKPNEKVKVIKSDFDLSYVIKDKILLEEYDNSNKAIHLMVEEYDTERLSRMEARKLNKIFENEGSLKNSKILIAAQPIKISRVAYQKDEGKEKKIFEVKHVFEELNNKSSQYIQNLESDHAGSRTPEEKRRKLDRPLHHRKSAGYDE